MGYMGCLFAANSLIWGSVFQRTRRISCGKIASKRLRCLLFSTVITENDCSHRWVVSNGTRTSNAFLAKLGNCARQQHQNLPAGMSINKAFLSDEFWRSIRKITIFFMARDVPPTKLSRTPKGYAVHQGVRRTPFEKPWPSLSNKYVQTVALTDSDSSLHGWNIKRANSQGVDLKHLYA